MSDVVVDATGVEHDTARPPERIVSLVPSLTETLFDLGLGDRVVGVTDFCIFPHDIPQSIPRLGGTKNPDLDSLEELAPDLVHMNVEENLPRHARRIAKRSRVFASEPRSVDDVCRLMRQLGSIHAVEGRASEWSDRIESMRASATGSSFSFVCAIWKDPWMWCGGDTYVSGLVETTGGRNLLHERERYPRIELEEIVEMRPDRIFLPDEPYVFNESDASRIQAIALSGTRVIGPFPGHLFTWHGTRTVKGLEFLDSLPGEEVAQSGKDVNHRI